MLAKCQKIKDSQKMHHFLKFHPTQIHNLPVEPMLGGELHTDPPSQLKTIFYCEQTHEKSFGSLH